MSRWNGEVIYFTKNCDGCEFYRRIVGKELCGKGKAFKYLEKPKKLRKCGIKDKLIENPSITHLDEIIKNPERYRLIKTPSIIQLKINFTQNAMD